MKQAKRNGRKTPVIGVLLVAMLATVIGQGANAAARKSILKKHTLITGLGSSQTEIVIPKQIQIANPVLQPREFTVRSNARFAGFALVPRDSHGAWIGGRVRHHGSDVYFFASLDPLEGGANDFYTLAAGQYDVFLLSNRPSAVEVKLNFDELQGRTTVRTSSSAVAEVKFPKVHTLNDEPSVHWLATTGRIPTKVGAQFAATWFTADRHIASSYEACFFKGRVPEPDRSVPACAAFNAADMHDNNTGFQVSTYPRIAATRGRTFVHAGRVYAEGEGWTPGIFSESLSVRSASTIGDVGAIAIWLGI